MTRPSIILLLVVLLAGVVGCVPSQVDSSSNSIIVVTGPPAVVLNPYSQSLAARQVGRAVFRGLMRPGEDLLPAADLVEQVPTVDNGGITDGGRNITYRITQGIKWHDGKPVTAHDVAFTIGLQKAGAITDEAGVDYSVIETVVADGPDTVRVRLSRPDAPLVWRLAPYVLPRHLLEASGDLDSDPYWVRPVGSGPFRVAGVTPGQSVDLEPVDGDSPAVQVQFAVDELAAAERFSTGEPAVWLGSDERPVGTERAVEATLASQWRGFFLNGDPARETSDPRVRRAVRAVISQEMSVSASLQAPYGFVPRVETPRAAKARVELAGSRSLRPLRVFVAAPTPQDGRRFDAMLRTWERAGIPNKLAPGSSGFYGAFGEPASLANGQWDVAVAELPISSPPGWAWPYAEDTFPSTTRPYAPGFQRVSDPEFERLRERARAAETPEEAASAHRAALERADALDWVIWDAPRPARALVRGVTGVSMNPVLTEALAGAQDWRSEPVR